MQKTENSFFSTLESVGNFTLTWAPRTIAATAGGYYGLGLAYEYEIMAAIDKIAIRVFKNLFGYAGLGAFMPTFQWYSAWGVRVVAGLIAAILYDIGAKIVAFVTRLFSKLINKENKAPLPVKA